MQSSQPRVTPRVAATSSLSPGDTGQSGEARIFLTQDNNLTAKVPLRRSILQCNLQQKYRLMGKHNPQRDDGPEKGLYRLPPIALLQIQAAIQFTLPFRISFPFSANPVEFQLT